MFLFRANWLVPLLPGRCHLFRRVSSARSALLSIVPIPADRFKMALGTTLPGWFFFHIFLVLQNFFFSSLFPFPGCFLCVFLMRSFDVCEVGGVCRGTVSAGLLAMRWGLARQCRYRPSSVRSITAGSSRHQWCLYFCDVWDESPLL